jgi:hypothetical protein
MLLVTLMQARRCRQTVLRLILTFVTFIHRVRQPRLKWVSRSKCIFSIRAIRTIAFQYCQTTIGAFYTLCSVCLFQSNFLSRITTSYLTSSFSTSYFFKQNRFVKFFFCEQYCRYLISFDWQSHFMTPVHTLSINYNHLTLKNSVWHFTPILSSKAQTESVCISHRNLCDCSKKEKITIYKYVLIFIDTGFLLIANTESTQNSLTAHHSQIPAPIEAIHWSDATSNQW